MEVSIQNNLRVRQFAKVLQCVGKVGDDLQVEAFEDRLELYSLCGAMTAYIKFTLGKAFFKSIGTTKNGLVFKVNIKV